jgi:2'-5' RNA ligase
MIKKRTQLTLFIDQNNSAAIEKVRQEFNPKQYHLIKSHVTLCRDNELDNIIEVINNLRNLKFPTFNLNFGSVTRFSDGQGVLLPAIGDISQFIGLRKYILEGIIASPKNLQPHITLMHPRNSVCTDEIFYQIQQIEFPKSLTFSKISLIEQQDEDKWRVIEEFNLLS